MARLLKPVCSRCRMDIGSNQVMVIINKVITLFLHVSCLMPLNPQECRCGAPARVGRGKCGECKLAFIEIDKKLEAPRES